MHMNNELYHHGIKGQRWGVRRFQNKDGARTTLGKKRRNDKIPYNETINWVRYHDDAEYRERVEKEWRKKDPKGYKNRFNQRDDENEYSSRKENAFGVTIETHKNVSKTKRSESASIRNTEAFYDEDNESKYAKTDDVVYGGKQKEIHAIARQAREIAKTESPTMAAKYVADKLKDYKYEYVIENTEYIKNGNKQIQEILVLDGANSTYSLLYQGGNYVGEYEYSKTRKYKDGYENQDGEKIVYKKKEPKH